MTDTATLVPDRLLSVRSVFGIDTDLQVPAFSERDEHVPEVDAVYRFNPDVTLAIQSSLHPPAGIDPQKSINTLKDRLNILADGGMY